MRPFIWMMRMKKMLLYSGILLGLLSLVGCSTTPEPDDQTAAINASLNSAAQSASVSLQQLSALEQAQHPGMDRMPFSNIHDPALDQLILARWYGPIEPLLSMVAVKVGYQFQVYGKKPAVPVLIDIDDQDNLVPAINVLRNISLQAGTKATLLIYPKQKVISLRYN